MALLLGARQSVRSIVSTTTLGRCIPTTNALTLRRVHDTRKNEEGPDAPIWPLLEFVSSGGRRDAHPAAERRRRATFPVFEALSLLLLAVDCPTAIGTMSGTWIGSEPQPPLCFGCLYTYRSPA